MQAFGTMFHDDGTWILWTGAVWVGRRAIADGHADVHRTVFRNSTQRGVSWGQNTRLADTVPDSQCFAELRKTSGVA
jgi:hypothetical protein